MAYMRLRVAAVLFGLLMIASLGCIDKPTTHEGSESKPAKSSDPAGSGSGVIMSPGSSDVATDPADINMTVAEYLLALKKGDGDSKYGGHYIIVTGLLQWYGHTKDQPYFIMDGTDLTFICPEGHLATKALPGQKTTLRGIWSGGKHGVEAWQFVKADGSPPAVVEADALAKQLATNAKAAAQQWGIYKSLIITGQITEVESKGAILFSPVGQVPRLICWLNPDTLREPEKVEFKVGQKVVLIGRFDALDKQLKIWEFVKFNAQ
jgi:hypothetical protein